MNRDSILQVTSSKNNAIGTGFVIDLDEKGVVLATCSHVVSACGDDALLVDGVTAIVKEDFSSKGLDLAILYVEGLQKEPFKVEAIASEKVKLFGYTQFNTKIRANVKGEGMEDIDAKYNVSLKSQSSQKDEGDTIEIIRLSSQHKISSGYSGSPVLCEKTNVVVGMVALEVSGNATESYTNYAISAKHILENYKITSSNSSVSSPLFVTEVFDTLVNARLVVLFSQDFTNINENQNILKVASQKKFKDGFYHFSVPSFLDDRREYFKVLAKSCGLSEELDNPHAWKVAMQSKLKEEPQRVMLFITDIENGNIEFDKQFAQIVRSLVDDFSNFSTIFIGKKDLASLVYGKGDLSPLNTATELFFPDNELQINEELIERQFIALGKYRNDICKYLKKETLGRHKVWSFTECINALFWKNLLVKNGKNFAWRDELTKQIGAEVFECDEDVL